MKSAINLLPLFEISTPLHVRNSLEQTQRWNASGFVLLANAHLNLNVQALASRHYLATEGYVVHSCNFSVKKHGFLVSLEYF